MSTEANNIIEGNKLIAEFMGYPSKMIDTLNGDRIEVIDFPGGRERTEHLDAMRCYNSSWDWLMPVVYKIELEGFDVIIQGIQVSLDGLKGFTNSCTIYNWQGKEIASSQTERSEGKTKIEAVWQAIIYFIKWYNQHKDTL